MVLLSYKTIWPSVFVMERFFSNSEFCYNSRFTVIFFSILKRFDYSLLTSVLLLQSTLTPIIIFLISHLSLFSGHFYDLIFGELHFCPNLWKHGFLYSSWCLLCFLLCEQTPVIYLGRIWAINSSNCLSSMIHCFFLLWIFWKLLNLFSVFSTFLSPCEVLGIIFFRPISQFILFSNFCFSKLPSTFLVSYCLLIFESLISLFKRGHSLSDNRYSWSYWGSKLVAFLFLAESHSWFFLFPLVIVDLWKFIFDYFNLRKNCGLNWGHFFLRRIYTFPSTVRQIEHFGGPWMNPRVSSSAGPPHFWPTAGSPEPVDGITDNRTCSILTTTPFPLLFVDSPSFQWVQKCKGHFLFSLKKPFILISLLAGNHRS